MVKVYQKAWCNCEVVLLILTYCGPFCHFRCRRRRRCLTTVINNYYHRKVLLSSFLFNGHTIEYLPQSHACLFNWLQQWISILAFQWISSNFLSFCLFFYFFFWQRKRQLLYSMVHCLLIREWEFNPLSPNSDQHQISPCDSNSL